MPEDRDQIQDVSIEEGSSISFWECPACLALTLPEGKQGHEGWHLSLMMRL